VVCTYYHGIYLLKPDQQLKYNIHLFKFAVVRIYYHGIYLLKSDQQLKLVGPSMAGANRSIAFSSKVKWLFHKQTLFYCKVQSLFPLPTFLLHNSSLTLNNVNYFWQLYHIYWKFETCTKILARSLKSEYGMFQHKQKAHCNQTGERDTTHANFWNAPYKLRKMYTQLSEPCTSYVHESKETLMKSNEDIKAYLQKRCMTLANLQQKKTCNYVSTEFRSTRNLGRSISTNLKDYKLLNTWVTKKGSYSTVSFTHT
jgi:hypothetical protein